MLRKKAAGQDSGDTIIGKGTFIQGELKGTGLIRVDGKVVGTIETTGDVVVGSGGEVQARIRAENVVAAGQVRGTVTAAGRLEISRTGKLYADATVGALVIEDGALFQGQCKMIEEAPKSREDLFADLKAVDENEPE